MERKGDILYDLLDSETGQWETYEKATTLPDGTAINDTNILPFVPLYRKSGTEYFKKTSLNVRPTSVIELGAVGDGSTNDTAALQKALDATGNLFIPYGYTFMAVGLVANKSIKIFGGGKIKAIDSTANLLTIDGNNVIVEGVIFEGDGTLEPSKGVPNLDRISLIRINGDNVTVRSCILNVAHQNFIHANGADNVTIANNTIVGGITTYDASDDTGYQGIRVVDSSNVIICDNNIKLGADGGKTSEAIYCGPSAGEPTNFHIYGNVVDGCYDHGVYAIAIKGLCIEGNVITSDSAAIALSSFDSSLEQFASAGIISANIVRGAGVNASTPGIFLRDANYVICDGNNVSGFGRGIMLRPVQYDSTSNTINGNIISNNTISGWTENGIVVALSGLSLGEMQGNSIRGNKLIADKANVLSTAIGITLSPGEIEGEIINKWNIISENTIIGGGDGGIFLANAESCEVKDNILTDTCISTGVNRWGIRISNTENCNIVDNHIEDTSVTPSTRGGIRGANTNNGARIIGNVIIGTDPSFAPVSAISGTGLYVKNNTPSLESTFQIRQLYADTHFLNISSDTICTFPDAIEGKQTPLLITNVDSVARDVTFAATVLGEETFELLPGEQRIVDVNTIDGTVYVTVRPKLYGEVEITGTVIDFRINGARYKNITDDLTLTTSNHIEGKPVEVDITNDDTNPHTVTVTDAPFPVGADNEIPAGGYAHISLQWINGNMHASIVVYDAPTT